MIGDKQVPLNFNHRLNKPNEKGEMIYERKEKTVGMI